MYPRDYRTGDEDDCNHNPFGPCSCGGNPCGTYAREEPRMGEEADYQIERMLDRCFGLGNNTRRYDREDLTRLSRTCQRCNTPGLFFRQLPDGKWRLHDASNNLHNCPRKDISNVSSFLSLLE